PVGEISQARNLHDLGPWGDLCPGCSYGFLQYLLEDVSYLVLLRKSPSQWITFRLQWCNPHSCTYDFGGIDSSDDRCKFDFYDGTDVVFKFGDSYDDVFNRRQARCLRTAISSEKGRGLQ